MIAGSGSVITDVIIANLRAVQMRTAMSRWATSVNFEALLVRNHRARRTPAIMTLEQQWFQMTGERRFLN
jgi:hypothetical protein